MGNRFKQFNKAQEICLLAASILVVFVSLYPDSETSYSLWRNDVGWYCFHHEIHREFILNIERHNYEKPMSYFHTGFPQALKEAFGTDEAVFPKEFIYERRCFVLSVTFYCNSSE